MAIEVNPMSKLEPLNFRKEVEIVVSAQAQKVLQHTGYTPEQFLDWALNSRKISYGGANVIEFLEKMEVVDVGSTH